MLPKIVSSLILIFSIAAIVLSCFWMTSENSHEPKITFLFGIVGFLIFLLDLIPARQNSLSQDSAREDLSRRNRQTMIDRVRSYWIEGVLNRSLYQETLLALELVECPDAVEHPIDLLVQRPDQVDQELPKGTQIIDVYDNMDHSLLILGAPGSGKTTMLLELLRALLTRAEEDKAHPIPVVFTLSTWAEQQQTLTKWLVEELRKRYYVPQNLAQRWIDEDQIMPLLDGLDEVAVEHRETCIKAINTFRQTHGLLPLVICGRLADYQASGSRLEFMGAVVIQPLRHDQVNLYLDQGGLPLNGVRHALINDSELWEVLDTPLMLNIFILAYTGQQTVEIQKFNDTETIRKYIFSVYTAEMLKRCNSQSKYTNDKIFTWLKWISVKMKDDNISVFYIDKLSSDWLPTYTQNMIAHVSRSIIFGLGLGISMFLGAALGPGLAASWNMGWYIGQTVFLELSLQGNRLTGIIFGLIMGIDSGFEFGIKTGFEEAFKIILYYPLPFTIIFIILFLINRNSEWYEPGEVLSWSWSGFRSGLELGLIFTVIIGLFTAFWVGLVFSLFFSLGGGIVVGIGFGLLHGLSTDSLSTRIEPNEGIKRASINGLCSGVIVGVVFGLASSIFLVLLARFGFGHLIPIDIDLTNTSEFILIFSIFMSLFLGYIVWLRKGGAAVLNHYLLRSMLIINKVAPWRYKEFLDYGTDCIFLRKVGGGYMFIHRYLLEYFATLSVDEKS